MLGRCQSKVWRIKRAFILLKCALSLSLSMTPSLSSPLYLSLCVTLSSCWPKTFACLAQLLPAPSLSPLSLSSSLFLALTRSYSLSLEEFQQFHCLLFGAAAIISLDNFVVFTYVVCACDQLCSGSLPAFGLPSSGAGPLNYYVM